MRRTGLFEDVFAEDVANTTLDYIDLDTYQFIEDFSTTEISSRHWSTCQRSSKATFAIAANFPYLSELHVDTGIVGGISASLFRIGYMPVCLPLMLTHVLSSFRTNVLPRCTI